MIEDEIKDRIDSDRIKSREWAWDNNTVFDVSVDYDWYGGDIGAGTNTRLKITFYPKNNQ